ncbi:hypothetical protein TNCV_4070651 [Trichonephila clavipes]|nr:hypothetical protein TNCV_4070651 [Trichonephila clavipes]
MRWSGIQTAQDHERLQLDHDAPEDLFLILQEVDTPHHPQTNGKNERVNQSLVTRLKCKKKNPACVIEREINEFLHMFLEESRGFRTLQHVTNVAKMMQTWLYRQDFAFPLNRHYSADHLIGTSVHAPQRPQVTYTEMGTVGLDPHGSNSDNENEMNHAATVQTSFEMRNIMKKSGAIQKYIPSIEVNNKLEKFADNLVQKRQCKEKYQEEKQADVPQYEICPSLTGRVASHCLSMLNPDFLTVLEIRVPIPQSVSISVVVCSLEEVIMPQGCHKASHTYSMGFITGKNPRQSIRVIYSLSSSC